jgi:hypothetical protein
MASKYNNVKTVLNGITFDSKAEARRYATLLILQGANEISKLELQPVFQIELNGHNICKYISDFRYFDNFTGLWVVEDVKSKFTAKIPMYRLKKKLAEAQYGIKIVEII